MFCFTPESGHVQRTSRCPLCANSGHFGLVASVEARLRFVEEETSHRGAISGAISQARSRSGYLTEPVLLPDRHEIQLRRSRPVADV
jgi:hypothetical protein